MTTPWNILVVEDEFDDQQVVSKVLTHHGVHVAVAHNGAECLAMLADTLPDMVVMDLAMPEMDGWETLAAIRADPATAHLRVVALTAYHSVDLSEDAARAGFDGYFAKPIDVHSFVERLAALMTR